MLNHPIHPDFRYIAYLVLVAIGLNLQVSQVLAQSSSFPFRQKNYEAKMVDYRQSLRYAQEKGDKKAEADALFYLALTRQQQANSEGTAPAAQSHLSEAEDYYKRTLAIRPDLASALNNLAQIYQSTGRKQEAEDLLKRAASGPTSSSQALSSQNYADLISSSRGDWPTAQKYYRTTATSQPDNLEAHTKLVDSYMIHNPHELGGYLWDLVNKGQVLVAAETALKSLGKKDLPRVDKEELLSITAASLARQTYNLDEFEKSANGVRLAELSSDPDVGEGAGEILLLHRKNTFEPNDYRWWARRGNPNEDPTRGVWPRDAFRQLIRALGQTYRHNDVQTAERYYLLSVRLDMQEPDPQACLVLADLYVEQGRLNELPKMLEQYAPALFYSKGQAYRKSQEAKIYEYHRTLGIMYSYVKQWGNNARPDSAIFQLEHADETAHRLGCSPEPRMIAFLAKAYRETGQPVRARELEQRPITSQVCGAVPST